MLQISEILKSVTQNRENFVEKTPTRFLKDFPPVIVWNVNNYCNMSCPHCYASAKMKKNANELTHETMLKIIDRLDEYGIKIIIFSGGEPLLRDDLFELISYAKSKQMSCHLSTNGTLIDDDMAVKIKKTGVQYVGISIDGMPSFNDDYRGLENGYNLALNGAIASKKQGLKVGLRITVSQKNLNQVYPLLQVSLDNDIDRFYISHLVYGGRGANFSKFDVSPQDTRKSMIEIFDTAVEYLEKGHKLQIVSGGNDIDGVLLYKYVQERFSQEKASHVLEILEKKGGNSAGEKVLNIDHKGIVHPDQFWQHEYCGNIITEPLKKILQMPLLQQLKNRTQYLKGKCKMCAFVDICRGSHRERALKSYNDLWMPDPACYLEPEELAHI